MEKNYVIKLLRELKSNPLFLSKKQKNYLIGLSNNDIKKIKQYCLAEQLIKQEGKEFVLLDKGLELIKEFKDKFNYLNLEYLKLDKTPMILNKAIRAYARYVLEGEKLKEDSLEETIKKEFQQAKRLNKKEIEDYILQEDRVNLEDYYRLFLSQGLTKSIASILLLKVIAENKDILAIYEKNQFQLNFNSLMFDRIIANPKNFEIQKTVLNNSFVEKSSIILECRNNILDLTKTLYLKFKELDKLTLNTTNLSPLTLKFKNLVLNAKDPIQLFNKDLNKILKNEKELKNSIQELKNFYKKTIEELKEHIFSCFKTNSLEDLSKRFNRIKNYINNKELLILGNNLNSIERLATYINQKRVPKDWSDLDIANFKLKTKELSNLFLIIETTIDSSNSTVEATTQGLINEILKLDKTQRNILLRKVV